ncbi:ABC transporter ATP-binding protein [bacterium]|nr:ABC transporter ATP-binding protein [bacterium]
MNTAIELHNIQKTFGKKQVLNGVSGRIEKGKVVGLLGRNGEGKTTLFRILLDIIASDSGYASVLGMIPNGTGKIRLRVGYVPERPSFHEFMRIEDIFRLREGFFPTWNWQKTIAMSKALELDTKTPVKGASKGTLAKTAWICATAHNPQILLLDEPTSGLDAVIRDSLLSHFVRELTREAKTILVANHHMEELLGVLDEVWILAGGRIVASCSLEELKQNVHQVTGRLKSTEAVQGLVLLHQQKMGDLVRWVVMHKETLYRIRQQELLSQMEISSLPVEETLKLLLSNS